MSKDTRNRILETAKQLIHNHGFKGTSLNDILTACGISKGNFFYYFKSKEELGFAVLEQISREVMDRLKAQAFLPELSPLEQINRMLDTNLEYFKQNGCGGGCPLGNLAAELADDHEEFRQKIVLVFQSWEELIKTSLDKARETNRLDESLDTQALTTFIISSLEGAITLMKVKKDIKPLEQTVAQMKLHLFGISKDIQSAVA